VTTTKPERPLIATVICAYETFALAAGLLLWWLIHAINSAHPDRAYPPTPAWQNIAAWLSEALLLAAIFTLWKMRKSAFPIFVSRFAISLTLFIAFVTRKLPTNPSSHVSPRVHAFTHAFTEAISVFLLVLSASIATYTYMILFRPQLLSVEPTPEPVSKWPLPMP
jgi:hypothetical protein